MKSFFGALIALVPLAGLGAQEPPRPHPASVEAVLARVQVRLGAAPIECGRHPLPASTPPPESYVAALTASVRCVTEAAAARRPSWMFVHQQGIDSWGGTGLLSGADGVVRQFYYDSDPSGGSNAAATLDTRACEAPVMIRRNNYVLLECNTTTGAR